MDVNEYNVLEKDLNNKTKVLDTVMAIIVIFLIILFITVCIFICFQFNEYVKVTNQLNDIEQEILKENIIREHNDMGIECEWYDNPDRIRYMSYNEYQAMKDYGHYVNCRLRVD